MNRTTPIEPTLHRWVHWGWTFLALGIIPVVGIIDYVTAPEITFSLFYLVPVAAAAWLSGQGTAIFASTAASIIWLCAEIGSSRLPANNWVYAWNFGVRLGFLMLVAVLLARLRETLVRERVLSRTDPLTGLLNARSFREIAGAEIARACRYGQPLSLAFVDVDDFKRVNDTRGHATGDRVLVRIGELMRAHLRSTDTAARYGGDEFAIILPVADELAARAAIAKLIDKLGAAAPASSGPLTFSVGVVTYPDAPPPLDLMLERADRLMYEVKSTTKNGARFATDPGPPSL
ncbi:MAG: GGDEF domain-containing protein [Betaproteobacteria bacterium]